jgi:hypothetical protein
VRRTLPLVLACLSLSAPSASRAVAGEDRPGARPADFDDLVARLGSPADPNVVRLLVPYARSSEDARADAVVGALWHAGGYAAARGLLDVAVAARGPLRASALDCFARLGIRVGSASAIQAVRDAMDDPEMAVRRQAFEAIAVLGTSDDLPALLAAAASPDGPVRTCAWIALPKLTGEKIQPPARRWVEWWSLAQADLRAWIQTAIANIDAGDDPSLVALARENLARHAWANLPAVEEAVRDWLESSEPRLHAEAYRVVAALRWGDLAAEVERALRYEGDAAARTEGEAAARLIGLPVRTAAPLAARPSGDLRTEVVAPPSEPSPEPDGR